ncbi:Uncharacterised protein family (UPF0175) [Salegentibacter echinorum]|uniref:Uncharacterized protein family (UPF0175) n=1 Tax=Salegentibacter echinorum TaxID=1073325 RepID=A0A1M5GAH5_SALEC|nr:UPF0175 family protein [Salegentibacter echinorum]SHG00733.1 Uncharacterised protein family (UPF0175) [Salegentibacter echinorum]
MEKNISITYPRSLASSLKLAKKEFENEMKIVSLVKLYELGKVSSGKASKVLGINRIEFLELIGKYQVSIFNFQNEKELNDEISNA